MGYSAGQVFISEQDQDLFGKGVHYEIYKKLGAHPSVENGVKGFYFAVWAPHAQSVSVVGEFNDWNPEANPMERLDILGIWQAFIPGVEPGLMYKFFIRKQNGTVSYKADPFACYAELRPGNASRTFDLSGFSWKDGDWMSAREKKDMNQEPLAIYEVHIGSWMRHPNREDEGFSASAINTVSGLISNRSASTFTRTGGRTGSLENDAI